MPAESHIDANGAVPPFIGGAFGISRLMAVTGVTTPMTTGAAAMLFGAVAISFVCSS
ncbi:hypothetical protein [Methylobacterium sp. J-070]|uniref:hypothetical protein n=1 Tax=Methylobacterium sp. J-070 TaxID=2836650 RepID=UPI001FBACB27|nr:hypothetical protein [Methylobacterium sp. J-070]MCJ2053103.1 hypothetical protein [Methylobacterium sp. J-070]